MNTFGHLFRLTDFGESHGAAIGGVVDGCPAGVTLDMDFIQAFVDRRRPGHSPLDTARREEDRVEILSGVLDGVTTGTPIGFIIRNTNQHSSDYDKLKDTFRPSHADYTYTQKYGLRDHRGGGRSSARETAVRVVGGAIAMLVLRQRFPSLTIQAEITEAGGERTQIDQAILQAKQNGETLGGIIRCQASGVPVGWGEPVFGKLQAELAYAMLSINAAKGFDYGSGFDGAAAKGSELNDAFIPDGNGDITTRTNHSGGIQGGISNGQDIYFRVVFKPIATLPIEQDTVNRQGEAVKLRMGGRHDNTVLRRALPVVEAMTAIVLADAMLQHRSARI
ncbi:MAG: chorismate synthase [Paludibacteraceae bacterium]|nr:chorismate synthase [Paludibacteraceae bacterium]